MKPFLFKILLLLGSTSLFFFPSVAQNSHFEYEFYSANFENIDPTCLFPSNKEQLQFKKYNNVALHSNHISVYQVYAFQKPILNVQVLVKQHKKHCLFVFPKFLKQFSHYAADLPAISYWWYSNGLIPVIENHTEYGIEIINTISKEIVFTYPFKKYYRKDSFVFANVFAPDPLSVQNKEYSLPFTDRKDSAYVELNAIYARKKVYCIFDKDSFLLADSLLSFSNISAPNYNYKKIINGNTNFKRNNPEFEQLNLLFHLQTLRQLWLDQGVQDYADTVTIDAHAFENLDESAFDPRSNPPRLEFGVGGVDDAEDADPIVHEYTHAAMNALKSGRYQGFERQSLEEGICDFMAAWYSQKFTPYQKNRIYNWDGHNEFWKGRTLNANKFYPNNITNQIHQDAEIFSATLYQFAEEIDWDTAIMFVLKLMPMIPAFMSMPQCAELILKIDSIEFQGRFSWPWKKAFLYRGFIPTLGQISKRNLSMQILNSYLFSRNQGSLLIKNFGNDKIDIYNANGSLIYSICSADDIKIEPKFLKSGVYFIRCKSFCTKIIKYE